MKVAVGGFDTAIRIWDTKTGACERTLVGHTGVVLSLELLSYASSGHVAQWLASASYDRTIKVWNLANGECVCTLSGHTDTIRELKLLTATSEILLLASAADDRTIRLWRTGPFTAYPTLHAGTLLGHTDQVLALERLGHTYYQNEDSLFLASASADRTVRIWSVRRQRCVHTLLGHSASVLALARIDVNDRLASASADGYVKIWSWLSGECEHTLRSTISIASIFTLKYLSGGHLACGHSNGTIVVWSVVGARGEEGESKCCMISSWHAHSLAVSSLEASEDGHTIVSASIDKRLSVWTDWRGGGVPTRTTLQTAAVNPSALFALKRI